LKRKILALIVISVIIVGASSYALYIYAFTTDGIPTGTCPEFSFVSGRGPLSLEGLPANMPFKMLSAGSGLSPEGSGISWCTYGSNDFLVRSYQTNSILNILAVSNNREYVAASGFSVYGAYNKAVGSVYLFDSSGRMLWNVSATSDPLFTPLINSNGSVIVGYGANLFYIDHQGKVLWNYSGAQSVTARLVNDVSGSGLMSIISGRFHTSR
jgi:hypothetical protein